MANKYMDEAYRQILEQLGEFSIGCDRIVELCMSGGADMDEAGKFAGHMVGYMRAEMGKNHAENKLAGLAAAAKFYTDELIKGVLDKYNGKVM